MLEARSAAAAQQSQAVDGTNAAGSNTNNDTTKAADGSKPPLGLTAEEALAADPFSGQQFAPWPSEQEMKSGALVTLKNGQIPWDMLGEEERKKAEKEKEKEERRARGEYVPDDEDEDGAKKDGDDQDKKNLMAAGGQQRAPGAGPGEVKKPKVNLSLDLYDPDEE